jgi:hypothetical protein
VDPATPASQKLSIVDIQKRKIDSMKRQSAGKQIFSNSEAFNVMNNCFIESLRSALLVCVIFSKFIDIAFKTEALLTETCIFFLPSIDY